MHTGSQSGVNNECPSIVAAVIIITFLFWMLFFSSLLMLFLSLHLNFFLAVLSSLHVCVFPPVTAVLRVTLSVSVTS